MRRLIAKGTLGWDYYLCSEIIWQRDNICPLYFSLKLTNTVYAIPNERGRKAGCRPCYFGDITYFRNIHRQRSKDYILTKYGRKIIGGFTPLAFQYNNISERRMEVTWDEVYNDNRTVIPYRKAAI